MLDLTLVRYHHHLWRQFLAFYAKECTWEELTRDFQSSYGTVAKVTMHAVNMEDLLVNYVLRSRRWDGPAFTSFTSVPAMTKRFEEVAQKTEKLVREAGPKEREKDVLITLNHAPAHVTLNQVLAEVVNESAHHRGEVLAMLWAMDKTPPYVSFLEYVQSTRRPPGSRE